MRATGTSMVHVPYRGGPAALNDLMGGSSDLLIEVFPVVMEQIKSGMIKGLAVSSPYRLPSVPDLPTFKEAGAIGVEPTGLGATEFTAFHAAEVKRWVAFMAETGLRK